MSQTNHPEVEQAVKQLLIWAGLISRGILILWAEQRMIQKVIVICSNWYNLYSFNLMQKKCKSFKQSCLFIC